MVASTLSMPRPGITEPEGAAFILAQGTASSKAGPLVATAYQCALVFKGLKLVGQFGYDTGFYLGPIYVPRGDTLSTCPPSGSNPSPAISGHEDP